MSVGESLFEMFAFLFCGYCIGYAASEIQKAKKNKPVRIPEQVEFELQEILNRSSISNEEDEEEFS